jgi:hypothetical protein
MTLFLQILAGVYLGFLVVALSIFTQHMLTGTCWLCWLRNRLTK